jgi:hypothetical protein
MNRHPKICDHCGGRFGMVTHRWWGIKFCKRTCKDAYLHELALGRGEIRRWYGFGRELAGATSRQINKLVSRSSRNGAARWRPSQDGRHEQMFGAK